jgi:hypothetical protein
MARRLLPSLTETKTAPFPSIIEVTFIAGREDRVDHEQEGVCRDQHVAGMEIFDVEALIHVGAFILVFMA